VKTPFFIYNAKLTSNKAQKLAGSPEPSFTIDENGAIASPAFLLITMLKKPSNCLLCKVVRVRNAKIGATVYALDCRNVNIDLKGVFGTIGMNHLENRELRSIPHAKRQNIKNAILKSSKGVVDHDYFDFPEDKVRSEVLLQANDAIRTGMRIGGIPDNFQEIGKEDLIKFFSSETYHDLMECQVLDFDWNNLFPGSERVAQTPDGKIFYRSGGRLLYLHKVHTTPIERALGVDLIYNYVDQGRLVFVQYKCHKSGKPKYYPSSDSQHDSELERMLEIPGVEDCQNNKMDLEELRLCRCPVFVKLCDREIRKGAQIPDSSYYAACIWSQLVDCHPGISRTTRPHLTNEQFQVLVHSGLIGSTRLQSEHIQQHLAGLANRHRVKLIFEEVKDSPRPKKKRRIGR
jgi:hypothetical protein